MHWGTFDLTDEPLGEPPLALAREAAAAGLAPGEFTAIAVGETVVIYKLS
jgi:N-acyl-phosphatidylethanolamine-hydrolysing phospholipase D